MASVNTLNLQCLFTWMRKECGEVSYRLPLPSSAFFSSVHISQTFARVFYVIVLCLFLLRVKCAYLYVPLNSSFKCCTIPPRLYLNMLCLSMLCPFFETLIWVKILQTAGVFCLYYLEPASQSRFCS